MNIKYLFFSLFALIVLSACKHNSIDIEVYTSDIKSVANGEVLEVPLKASFNLMGKDKEGDCRQSQHPENDRLIFGVPVEASKKQY